jgi:hypothetical protein
LAEHVFETFLVTWIQNGPIAFEKKHSTKKQYTHRIMIILCQRDFKE